MPILFFVPEQAVWRWLPSRTFCVVAGEWDVPGGRGGARRCAEALEVAVGAGAVAPDEGSVVAPGRLASRIWGGQVFGVDVGSGGGCRRRGVTT